MQRTLIAARKDAVPQEYTVARLNQPQRPLPGYLTHPGAELPESQFEVRVSLAHCPQGKRIDQLMQWPKIIQR